MSTSFSIRVPCPNCGRTPAVLMRRTRAALRLFCPGCRHTWEQAVEPAPGPGRGTPPPPRGKR